MTHLRRLAGAMTLVVAFSAASALLFTQAAPAATDDYLTVDASQLSALPTNTTPWESLKTVADGDLGMVDLADQDNTNAGRTVAAALAYARTGSTRYKTKVIDVLATVDATTLHDARVLSVGRQIAGYVIAADLVGYRAPTFVRFISDVRTRDIGDHPRWKTLTQTSEDTANNWGTWAMASRIAGDAYLDDTADLARAAQVFRGWLGDRTAYSGFNKTADFDPNWVCGSVTTWVPINPAGCGAKDGAVVEDVSRSVGTYPTADETSRTYRWEALGGATLSASILARRGYPGVWDWSDKALLRAAEFEQRHGGRPPSYSVNQYIPWTISKVYDVHLGTVNSAGLGRQYGFTDWLPAPR